MNTKNSMTKAASENCFTSAVKIILSEFEQADYISSEESCMQTRSVMEFHVSRHMRDKCHFDLPLFGSTGNVILANFKNVRLFAKKINDTFDPVLESDKMIKAGQLNAMGLIDEIFHYVCTLYRRDAYAPAFGELLAFLKESLGSGAVDELLLAFTQEFPPAAVYSGEQTCAEYLEGSTQVPSGRGGASENVSNKVLAIEELMLLYIANENPAFAPFSILFNDDFLALNPDYTAAYELMNRYFKEKPPFGPNMNDLLSLLHEPIVASPDSLKGQLNYIRLHWGALLGEWLLRLLAGIDMISEEEKPGWSSNFSGPPPMEAYNYDSLMKEYERFSPDRDWMPRVVLMAKTVLVWLDQLSKKYGRDIHRLDQIPDEELDLLAQQGFTGLWLIGLWERSWASRRIKQICGNPDAAASAYSLHDYEIAQELGGWDALDNLRRRLWYRGIRLASDMVPNHTGMDSKWVSEHPDRFIQTRDCPFPTYSFTGENLSLDSRVTIQAEDHYYSKTDCAVVFKRIDNATGDTRYIYHGNDGTGMPWNDTAQIDFLNPEAREAVIQEILHVARNFPIIRFDAAMVLAKKHIRRLWYPEPGHGGDIASRAEYAISHADFEKRIPEEFWREVVDRVAAELPDTLLLAEAFWMMEGYFVRTLGMHRVYNSAFMNMLKKEENQKYRDTVKNTLEFDPQVLKRFVNFMNNPDEETAVAQFGTGDKYFGVCTMMVTMPGLPMFGHGQIEGFSEKYGMEFRRAYWDEKPNQELLERHRHDIFPLMKKRYLFAEIENFRFYDVWNNGSVNENVFAYSNRFGSEKTVVFYNNVYQQASGRIKNSCRFAVNGEQKTSSIGEMLELTNADSAYCIFYEQHSGLWFIRKSRDIIENGLYVFLNGFEYQVLINISEVADDSTGKYGLLCDALGGRGVQDIDVALREIFLKDLYKALTDFLAGGFIENIALLCKPDVLKKKSGQKTPPLSDVLEQAEENGMKWLETLEIFLAGNYGSAEIFSARKTGKKLTLPQIWKSFSGRIARLVQLSADAQKAADTLSGKEQANSVLCRRLYEEMLARPFMAEQLAAFTILYSIKDSIGSEAAAGDVCELISLWGLDRKICDILSDCGCCDKGIYRSFCAMTEVCKICGCDIELKHPESGAYTVVHSLLGLDKATLLLGVNRYNNQLWFNKEKMSDMLWITEMLYFLYAADPAECAPLHEIIRLAEEYAEKSGYCCETFEAMFKPADKPLKKTATKRGVSKASKPETASARDSSASSAKASRAENAEKKRSTKK
ncbi:MAG: alpha-amylase family glycosyl hydrolase [Bacteroides sp.]|nr:alpha-amylase family glycosyl hydrolase [Prevotella sp.]MCM1408852.1 alpha-amylase family glycosyl hydrolase [Treponema brennaborense]MCM1470788.1 alpha-amylase family glycosyl hydrolase [Bacteroides sp.]